MSAPERERPAEPRQPAAVVEAMRQRSARLRSALDQVTASAYHAGAAATACYQGAVAQGAPEALAHELANSFLAWVMDTAVPPGRDGDDDDDDRGDTVGIQ